MFAIIKQTFPVNIKILLIIKIKIDNNSTTKRMYKDSILTKNFDYRTICSHFCWKYVICSLKCEDL